MNLVAPSDFLHCSGLTAGLRVFGERKEDCEAFPTTSRARPGGQDTSGRHTSAGDCKTKADEQVLALKLG